MARPGACFTALSLPLESNAAGQRIARGRPILVVRRVVLARPQHLHRLARRLRALDRRRNEVDVEPATEAAAEERRVHEHFLRRQSRRLRGRAPARAAAPASARRGDSRPRETRRCSSAARASRARASAARTSPRRVGRSFAARLSASPSLRTSLPLPLDADFSPAIDRRVGQLRVRARRPFDLQRIARLLRLPPGIRDHRDAGRRLQHMPHARHRLALRPP